VPGAGPPNAPTREPDSNAADRRLRSNGTPLEFAGRLDALPPKGVFIN